MPGMPQPKLLPLSIAIALRGQAGLDVYIRMLKMFVWAAAQQTQGRGR